jgi:hypothetical protein
MNLKEFFNPKNLKKDSNKNDMDYDFTINSIINECGSINLTKPDDSDGRISSAIAEKPYLSELKKRLVEKYVFSVEIPNDRHWYDIKINDIPINLKITAGNTSDNALNKVAVIYTLTGIEVKNKNMNFDCFYKHLKNSKIKEERDRKTEYHYLVINKTNGNILLKSILDIHTYKSNPSNILQINWNNEFKFIDYHCESFNDKATELLLVIQKSVREAISSMETFAEAEISDLF